MNYKRNFSLLWTFALLLILSVSAFASETSPETADLWADLSGDEIPTSLDGLDGIETTRTPSDLTSYNPATLSLGNVKLPIGKQAIELTLNESGLYELTYDYLQAAGMSVDTIDPSTLQMMHAGYNVSYEFSGDNDAIFESGESLVFYGQAFEGTRFDKLYSTDNIYWIWANGSASTVPSVPSAAGNTAVTTAPTTLIKDPENNFHRTYNFEWDEFEPDSWYWAYFFKTLPDTTVYTDSLTVELPNITSVGDAHISTEVISRSRVEYERTLSISTNGNDPASKTWRGSKEMVLTQTIPASTLTDTTTVQYVINNPEKDKIYVNSIQVDYTQGLNAIQDELIFNSETAGDFEFQVSRFATDNVNRIRVWDISDANAPVAIELSASDIVSDASGFTYNIGATSSADSTFIATTLDNLRIPISASPYTAVDLEPSTGSAEWVAVSHADFIPQANRLATHRENISGFSTHVIDIDHLFNQYAAGFHTPEAVRNYLRHGLQDWATPPQYLVLFGNGTLNPKLLECTGTACLSNIEYELEPNYIPTYLTFVDRAIGIAPSDFPFTLLTGDDLIPELAVGRITSNTVQESENTVDKILQHEANLNNQTPSTENLIFLADNTDGGGNFCFYNSLVQETLPTNFNQTDFCFDDYVPFGEIPSTTDKENIRNDVLTELTTNGALILNYRGHGSVGDWGGNIINMNAHRAEFQNQGLAGMILSADCLDGNFAWLGQSSLGQTFLALDQKRGSAAHWSASGLGYTTEHSKLQTGFYEGVFDNNLYRIGDAINYSKIEYFNAGYDSSEMFSFILQGDPAMPIQRIPTETGFIAGPLAEVPNHIQQSPPGESITYNVTITNLGTDTDTFTVSIGDDSNGWESSLSQTTVGPLAPGETVTVQVTVVIPEDAILFDANVTTVTVTSETDADSDFDFILSSTAVDSESSAVSLSHLDASVSPANATLIGVLVTMTIITAFAYKRKWS